MHRSQPIPALTLQRLELMRHCPVQAVHDASVAAQTNVLDATALLRDYIKLTSDNPAAARKLANQAGLTLDDGSWQTRLRSFLTTGVDYQTNIKISSPKRLYDDIEALSQADKDKLNKGLMSANELDNRRNNAQRGTPARYDYYNQDDQALARAVADAQRDPVLNDLMNRYKDITTRLIEIGRAHSTSSVLLKCLSY